MNFIFRVGVVIREKSLVVRSIEEDLEELGLVRKWYVKTEILGKFRNLRESYNGERRGGFRIYCKS